MARPGLLSRTSFDRALAALLLLNLFDAVSTALWVAWGVVEEGNPMMAQVLSVGFGPFVLGKVALVGLGAAMLWRLRGHVAARLALLPTVLLYGFVGGNHVGIALGLLRAGCETGY